MLYLFPVNTSRVASRVISMSCILSAPHVTELRTCLQLQGGPLLCPWGTHGGQSISQFWRVLGRKDGFGSGPAVLARETPKAGLPGASGRGLLILKTKLQEEPAALPLLLDVVMCWCEVWCGCRLSKKPHRAEDRETSPEACPSSKVQVFEPIHFPFCLSQFMLGAKTSAVIHLISILFLVIH